MSVEWIKMRKSLLACPQVVRISSALKTDRFRTIGALFAAWCVFDDQTVDGLLDGYTPKIFDEVVGVVGLCDAMVAVGWIKTNENALEATRFSEHNGQTAKRRATETVRKMSARNADKKQTESGVEKKRVLGAAPNPPTKQPATPMDTIADPNGKSEPLAIPAPKAKKEKFDIPTITEVVEYCESKAFEIDPEAFWDYYQAQGWKLANGRTMKDWQCACRTWNRKETKSPAGTKNGYYMTEAQKKLHNSDKAGDDWVVSMTELMKGDENGNK